MSRSDKRVKLSLTQVEAKMLAYELSLIIDKASSVNANVTMLRTAYHQLRHQILEAQR